jgi:hypothetical protein
MEAGHASTQPGAPTTAKATRTKAGLGVQSVGGAARTLFGWPARASTVSIIGMTDQKDRDQRIADALDALGATQPEGKPDQQPAAPEAAPAPQSPVGQKPTSLPPASLRPAAPQAAAAPPIRVTVKTPGKPPPAGKPAKPKKVEPPPPPLTPLARVALARRIAFRRTVIPILVTTGLAMLLLGCWAVSVLLLGRIPFRPDAQVDISTQFFARLCLLAWPIGVILLTGAVILMFEVHRYYNSQTPPPTERPAPPPPSSAAPPGGTPKG